MVAKKLRELLFSLEFIAIFSISLYFYSATWAAGFRLIGESGQQSFLLNIAYVSLAMSLFASIILFWTNHTHFLRHKIKTLGLALLLVLIWTLTREVGILSSFIVGAALAGANDRKIFISIFISSSILFLIAVLLGADTLVAGNKVDTGLFADRDTHTELLALGFTNPNVAYQFFMPALLSGLYLFGRRKRHIVIFAILSTVIGIATGSTAGFLVAILSCLFFLAINRKPTRRIAKRLAPYGMLLMTLVTFALTSAPLLYHTTINDALTGRPAFWQLRTENLSFLNLAGDNDSYAVQPPQGEERCEYVGGGNAIHCFPLDNTPLYIMVHYGIVVFAIYLVVYYRAGKIIKDPKILLIGLLLLLLLLLERTNFMNNIYLLFAIKHLTSYDFDIKNSQEKQ